MKGAGGFERSGAQGQRTEFTEAGNPVRRFGYPRGWVASDPRNRDPREEILYRLDRIEALLTQLVARDRLP